MDNRIINQEVYPLSASQMGIYLSCMQREGEAVYNNPLLFQLGESVDMEKLARAFYSLMVAHPVIGAGIALNEEGQPVQFSRGADFCEPVVEQVSEAEFAQIRKSLIQPFNLLTDALFRVRLFVTEQSRYLFMDFHHIIYDGTSLGIILEDLEKAYLGEEPVPETCSMFELAERDNAFAGTEAYQAAKEWNLDTFGGIETDSLPIPDRTDSEIAYCASEKKLALAAQDAEKFCRGIGVTENALAVGSYGFLLATYANAEDALFSTIWHGRKKGETDRTVGMLVRTLPVCAHLVANASVCDYLNNLRTQISRSRENSGYPFSEIVRQTAVTGDLLFAYQGELFNHGTFASDTLAQIPLMINATGEKLVLELFKKDGGYILRAEYQSNLYSEDFIRDFLDSYDQIFSEMTYRENLSDILPANEKQIAGLDKLNETEVPYDDSETVVSLFRKAAERFPDNTAVIFKDISLTYAETDEQTDRIALAIKKMGLGRGDVVSVLIPRGEYQVIASLGVLKAGCAYQPLDTTYPAERLNFMVGDAGAKLLITTEELRPIISDYDGKCMLLSEIKALQNDEEKLSSSEMKALLQADEIVPEDLFILLYTSGSTGTPKGVRLTHANLVCFIDWYERYYELTEEDHVAQYASYGFDACMMDMYPALSFGAAVVIVPEEIRLDMEAINAYLTANHVTIAFFTTQVGRQFALIVSNSCLRHVSTGGEKLSSMDPPEGFSFHNLYGPTECTILSTCYRVTEKEKNIPIGHPLDNLKCYIVNAYGHRVPKGASGELWIAGPHVADGYLNQPEKTAEVFIENPFNGEKYARVYRSGDIVRYREDGEIEFIGRQDGQVKIRGFRIELSEVEAVIRECPGVKDAAAMAIDSPSGGKYLAACVVCDGELDTEALRSFIRDRKPPYMIPAALMQIDRIPLNQNGKINRRALPVPVIQFEDTARPETEEQQKVYDIAVKILGTDAFGINTDLYEAGLSSISAMALTGELSRMSGKTVRFADVREHSTVKELADYLAHAADEDVYDIREEYPLTQTQQGVYVECLANENSTIYNIPELIRLSGEVDVERLKKAVGAAMDAHPYLKMTLRAGADGSINAVRQDDAETVIEEINCKTLPGDDELVRPFSILDHRLYRILLIRTLEDLYLFMDFHHILFDGTSMMIFLEDIDAAYAGRVLDKETYTGFEAALDEEKARKGTSYEEASKWYDSILNGCETDYLPPESHLTNEDSGPVEQTMPGTLDPEAVKSFCAERHISVNAFWCGVLGLVIARYNNTEESLYTTVYNGRNDSRLARAATMLVKTIPLLCKTGGERKTSDYFAEVGRQLTQSMAHDIFSFADITREYGVRSNILFVYQGDSFEIRELCGKPCLARTISSDEAKAPIEIQVFLEDGRFRFFGTCHSRRYAPEFLNGLLMSLQNAAYACLRAERLKDVTLLNGEMEEILDRFNETDVPIASPLSLPEQFIKCAEEYPENIAVIYRDVEMTYRELDKLTDSICADIHARGIGKGDCVSILIGRNEFMPAAALGVMKSGATYQPLDPTYPPERLKFMMEDASAKLLIADESLLHLVPDRVCDVLTIASIRGMMAGDLPSGANENPTALPSLDDVMILLYTSGSTGTPKGVRLTQGNLATFCQWYRRFYGLTPENRVLAYASFGFDANMMDTYPALTTGAAVCIVPEDMRLNYGQLDQYIKDKGVTHAFMTTQVGRIFSTEMPGNSLWHLSMGGEKLVPFEPKGSCRYYNGYGPTETTVFATCYPMEKLEKDVPIGKALDNLKLYVLDLYGHRQPVGAAGELCIAGPQVSVGYLNRPEKTAEVFVRNPFTDDPKYDRMYRTGDIVSILEDGNVRFVGRRDGQVKIRGFRVELTEVESIIREYPGIKDATVVAFDEPAGGKFIAAYVVSDAKIDIESLNTFIRSSKPPYMVPAVTMQIERIPLNQNQKVNRRALPVPERQTATEIRLPETALQEKLCSIFSQVLGVEKVGIDESFFDLGGTSLTASRVVMKAMLENLPLVYADLFDCRTVSALEKCILEKNAVDKTMVEKNAEDAEKTAESGKRTTGQSISNGGASELKAVGQDSASVQDDGSYRQSADPCEAALRHNIPAELAHIQPGSIGNVLLTGPVGFLGIHVLKALIDKTDARVYCLMHKGKGKIEAGRMLQINLFLYFDDPMQKLMDNRIFVLEGDITDPDSLRKLPTEEFDTVINCAANVRHFDSDGSIERVNTYGAKVLADFCSEFGKRMIQVSTGSVAGTADPDMALEGVSLKECELFIGQQLDNKYIHSKYMAEQYILKAVAEEKLDAKIIRVGNLMSRYTDGEFQKNFESNNFMRQLRAYVTLGCIPVSALDAAVEFSPIDKTAEALVLLGGTDSRFTVFQASNGHIIEMGDVVDALNDLDLPVEVVTDEEFAERIREAMDDEKKSMNISALLSYNTSKGQMRMIPYDNHFTVKALYRLGFKWPMIEGTYLRSAIEALKTLDFFV